MMFKELLLDNELKADSLRRREGEQVVIKLQVYPW